VTPIGGRDEEQRGHEQHDRELEEVGQGSLIGRWRLRRLQVPDDDEEQRRE